MPVRHSLIAALTILSFLGAARAGDAVQKEIKKLQGAWQLASMEESGKKRSAQEVEKYSILIKGDKVTALEGDKIVWQAGFKLVEVQGKSRKTDLSFNDDSPLKGLTSRNIAEWIDDNSFRTCAGLEQRPTDYSSTEENKQLLFVFKRVKK